MLNHIKYLAINLDGLAELHATANMTQPQEPKENTVHTADVAAKQAEPQRGASPGLRLRLPRHCLSQRHGLPPDAATR